LLILFQSLILNNINFGGYINPYLYILFVIFLPFETPKWLVLILGFALGVGIDSFANTLGMHTSASVFLAFCRAYLLKLIEPRDGYPFNSYPNLRTMGLTWYLSYALTLILMHHIFLFFVESFKFTDFFSTLGRTFASTFFTLVLVFVVQLFSFRPDSKI